MAVPGRPGAERLSRLLSWAACLTGHMQRRAGGVGVTGAVTDQQRVILHAGKGDGRPSAGVWLVGSAGGTQAISQQPTAGKMARWRRRGESIVVVQSLLGGGIRPPAAWLAT